MINTAGAYLLVITLVSTHGHGVTVVEMENREACEAARTQLEVVPRLNTYCIAATVLETD